MREWIFQILVIIRKPEMGHGEPKLKLKVDVSKTALIILFRHLYKLLFKFFILILIGYKDSRYFFKSNCPRVGLGTIGGMSSVGIFLRDPNLYLLRWLKKNSFWLFSMMCHGLKNKFFLLSSLLKCRKGWIC